MLTKDYLTRQISVRRDEILKLSPDILKKYPIEFYMWEVKSYRNWSHYYYLSPELKGVFENILKEAGTRILAKYHQLILAVFIEDAVKNFDRIKVPRVNLQLYHEWFERILKDFSTQPDEYYDYKDFPFLMDLAVCSLRAIPIGGAWILEVSQILENFALSTIRNSLNRKKTFIGLKQFVRPILVKIGILKLYYQIHTFARYLPRFTPEEMDKAYIRIAELLKLNKSIRGLYRRSWFLDPYLEEISPELVYLRKVPEQNGARVFRDITFQITVENALAFSPKRRKLYLEDKYTPTCYAFIWPRKKMIAWAEREKNTKGNI